MVAKARYASFMRTTLALCGLLSLAACGGGGDEEPAGSAGVFTLDLRGRNLPSANSQLFFPLHTAEAAQNHDAKNPSDVVDLYVRVGCDASWANFAGSVSEVPAGEPVHLASIEVTTAPGSSPSESGDAFCYAARTKDGAWHYDPTTVPVVNGVVRIAVDMADVDALAVIRRGIYTPSVETIRITTK